MGACGPQWRPARSGSSPSGVERRELFSALRSARFASFSLRFICSAFSRSRFASVVLLARPMASSLVRRKAMVFAVRFSRLSQSIRAIGLALRWPGDSGHVRFHPAL